MVCEINKKTLLKVLMYLTMFLCVAIAAKKTVLASQEDYYTVTWNGNGGYISYYTKPESDIRYYEKSMDVKVKKNSSIKDIIKIPLARDGWVFLGYKVEGDDTLYILDDLKIQEGQKYLSSYVISADVVFKAQWELATESSGKCGDNASWKLSKDGTMTISGSGGMYDYGYYGSGAPIEDLPEWCRVDRIENGSNWYIHVGTDRIKNIIVEDGITHIGNSAFYMCRNVESLFIGSDVESIGERSFYGLDVDKIHIPGNVKLIGKNAFRETNASSIELSDGIEFIDDYAFAWFGSYSEIKIPPSVKHIGSGVFGGNYLTGESKLVKLSVDEDNCVYDSRDNCNAIIETETNTVIQGCKTTVLPKSVDKIGTSAFTDTEIENIDLSNVNYIGPCAFQTTKLKKIYLSDELKEISHHAFGNCKYLEEVKLPANLEKIGIYAFYKASIKKIVFPDTLVYIGEGAFDECNKLYDVNLPPNIKHLDGSVFRKDAKIIIIPESVEELNIPRDGEILKILNYKNIKELTGETSCKKIIAYQCDFGKWKSGHVYSIPDGTNKAKFVKENIEFSDSEWESFRNSINNICNASETELHFYAQTKEEIEGKQESGDISETSESTYSTSLLTVSPITPTPFSTAYPTVSPTTTPTVNPDKTITIASFIPKLNSVKNKRGKKLFIKWKKVKGVDGYQVQYALNSSFTKSKKSKTLSKSKNTLTVKSLKKKKKYFVRVRTYVKDSSGKMVYSDWSNVKKVTIKK